LFMLFILLCLDIFPSLLEDSFSWKSASVWNESLDDEDNNYEFATPSILF